MKNFIRIGLILSLCVGCGSAEELPNDVQLLVSKRNAAIAKIDHTFIEELEKLKVKYTKAGELESANATVALIDKFRVEEFPEPSLSELPKEVYGKSFNWSLNGRNEGNRLIIFEGGNGTFGGKAITWKKISGRKVRLAFKDGNTEIEWSPDYQTFSGIEQGREVIGRQIE